MQREKKQRQKEDNTKRIGENKRGRIRNRRKNTINQQINQCSLTQKCVLSSSCFICSLILLWMPQIICTVSIYGHLIGFLSLLYPYGNDHRLTTTILPIKKKTTRIINPCLTTAFVFCKKFEMVEYSNHPLSSNSLIIIH